MAYSAEMNRLKNTHPTLQGTPFEVKHAKADGVNSPPLTSLNSAELMAGEQDSKTRRKVFVNRLNHETTQDSFREYFSKFGKLVNSVVMCDPYTKKSHGFGILEYATAEQADACLAASPHIVDGKVVEIKRVGLAGSPPNEGGGSNLIEIDGINLMGKLNKILLEANHVRGGYSFIMPKIQTAVSHFDIFGELLKSRTLIALHPIIGDIYKAFASSQMYFESLYSDITTLHYDAGRCEIFVNEIKYKLKQLHQQQQDNEKLADEFKKIKLNELDLLKKKI